MRAVWIFLAVTAVPAVRGAEPAPQLKLLVTPQGAQPRAYAPIAFSPDGKLLAWGDQEVTPPRVEHPGEGARLLGSVKLWDVARRKVVATLRDSRGDCDYGTDGVVFSPDGKTLLALCGGKVKLWDVATRKEKVRLERDPMWAAFLAFSPDGKVIASATDDGKTVVLRDAATGKKKASLEGLPEVTLSAAFSPDGKLFAAGGGHFGSEGLAGDGEVKLFDAATGRERASLKGGVRLHVTLQSLEYLKAEGVPKRVLLRLLALKGREFPTDDDLERELRKILEKVPDKDRRKKYLGLVYRDIERSYPGPEVVRSLAFSPDGKTLATASCYGSVLLWDVKTGKRKATLQRFNPHGRKEDMNPAYCVAFSPDGNTLAAGTFFGIKLWDMRGDPKAVALGRPLSTVWSVAFSPDGKTIASAGSKGIIGPRDPREGDPTLRLWEWVPARKADR